MSKKTNIKKVVNEWLDDARWDGSHSYALLRQPLLQCKASYRYKECTKEGKDWIREGQAWYEFAWEEVISSEVFTGRWESDVKSQIRQWFLDNLATALQIISQRLEKR